MTPTPPDNRRARRVLLAWPALVACFLAIVGYVPTRRAQGLEGVTAMFAGLGLVLAAALVSMSIAANRMAGQPAAERFRTVLAAGVVRFFLTISVATTIAWRQVVSPGIFLIWTGAGYVIITMVETVALLQWSRRLERSDD